jgi:DNA modification methylase
MTINKGLYGTGLITDHKPTSRGILNDKFLMSPFSVWNTREGFWQDRKRRWLNWCGIKSEEGREDKLTFNIPIYLSDGRTGNKIKNQTSIFDPVVCELCYTWWTPPGAVVLDPFAGGSVRGITASILGRKYFGIDLRREQVEANIAQITADNRGPYKPKWVCGDSIDLLPTAPEADFIFSCPPYGNLERYSEDPKDISTMDYGAFLAVYREIISRACSRLRPNRFAAWVVGNYREGGIMHDLVGDTIQAFEACGMGYYNDIILVNSVGSGAMRTNGTFIRGHRKIVKMHQNVLVFVKGYPAEAAEYCGPAEEGTVEE